MHNAFSASTLKKRALFITKFGLSVTIHCIWKVFYFQILDMMLLFYSFAIKAIQELKIEFIIWPSLFLGKT